MSIYFMSLTNEINVWKFPLHDFFFLFVSRYLCCQSRKQIILQSYNRECDRDKNRYNVCRYDFVVFFVFCLSKFSIIWLEHCNKLILTYFRILLDKLFFIIGTKLNKPNWTSDFTLISIEIKLDETDSSKWEIIQMTCKCF